MHVIYPCCAGLDVHKKTVVACRMKAEGSKPNRREVKTFSTMTRQLLALSDWLSKWGCTHVAMESTGEYWKPTCLCVARRQVFNVLEANFEVLLVNAQHVKQVPGRKTDVRDTEWLAGLLQHLSACVAHAQAGGLLKASFIPPAPQRDLRDLTRYRTTLVQEHTRVVNRVQKVLEGANIKLSSVASDTLGVSGRAILKALIQGQEDPAQLAQLAKGRLRNKKADLKQALTGFFRPHHRFLLSHLLVHLDFLEAQLSQLSDQIAQLIEAMSVPPKDPKPPSGESPAQSQAAASSKPAQASPLLPNQALALWDTIPGVNQTVAEVMVAEMGVDLPAPLPSRQAGMSRFPTHGHVASWVGLAPGNNESAGKHQSGRTTKGNPALRLALIQAAWAASHTKDTYLSTLYRRLAARRGKKRALVAVAHSILTAAYHMALGRETYQELGSNYFDQRKKQDVVSRLSRRLKKLGYNVALTPQAA